MRLTRPRISAARRPAASIAILFSCAAALFAGPGCSDRDKTAPIGLGNLEPGRFEEVVRLFVASPPDSDRFAESVTSVGDATTLYVGHYGTRRMRSLIRFAPIPSGLVREARVVLTVTGSAGPEAPVTVEAHRIRSDWNESTVDDTLPPAFDVDPIATVVSAPGETLLSIEIPDSLLTTWGGDVTNNLGLLLSAAGTDSTLRKFGSSEALTRRPLLRLVLDTGGGVETVDSVFADRDAYLTKADTTQDRSSGPLLLIGRQNGFTYRSTVFFQIPESIDERSTINSAILVLSIDRPASAVDSGFAVGAHAPVADSLDLFLSSPEANTLVTATSDTIALNLTDFVGRQRLARRNSIRILVRSSVELADTRFAAVVSDEGAPSDPTLAPRIRFIVSSPAGADSLLVLPATSSGPLAPDAPGGAP